MIETKGGNYKVSKQWKINHGYGTVTSWLS
ncbi:hypothetical protein ACM7UQ_12315 [Pseudomonas aeruginosa]